jgi:hypothetical protein
VWLASFSPEIVASWSSYERRVFLGTNWEQAGSDCETFHAVQERLPIAARTHTTSIFFPDDGCMCPCLQSERQASTILTGFIYIFFQPNKHPFCFSNETRVPVHLTSRACYKLMFI